jgi:hypothetical protein
VAVGQTAARRRTRPSQISLLLGVARWAVALVGLGTLLVLGFGFWLLDLTDYGLEGWVVATLALLGFALATGGLAGRRPSEQWRRGNRMVA